ncbi:hypothetical protein ACT4WO_12670 [Acinetobacter baumannii]|uniref:hypothetical protein n=1 Tax=Acinetobacter baumannii TaxID=470 RepID=UPI0037BF77B8
MTEFQKITYEIGQLQRELNHTGSCTTRGLTQEEIAQLDERFFLAIAKQNKLIARLRTEYASQWLKNLKRQILNGSDQTISSN